MSVVKVKFYHTPLRERRRVLISLFKALSPYVENHYCLQGVATATTDLRLPVQLQGITAHWPLPNCTA